MITVSGIGSGLDIEGIVTQLVAAERAPTENRLNRLDARLDAGLSAFGTYKSALSAFQDSLRDLTQSGSFGRRTSTSSDADIVAVTTGGAAVNGNYDVTVSQLAKAHSLASGAYASAAAVVGTGSLTLRFGTTDYTPPEPGPESYNGFTVNPERAGATIEIGAGNNTLQGVRDAINDADIGVNATIVNDGSGFRLLLSSELTGARNSIEISVSDSGDGNDTDAAGLSALTFNGAATQLSQTVAAQDASFTINGLPISSAENTASGVIDGVDLTLKNLTGAVPVSVTVSEDRAGLKEKVQGFVDGFNAFVSATASLTAFDAASGTAGALQGDSSVRAVNARLRQVLTDSVQGSAGPFTSLSEIGITTNRDGTLGLDAARFDAVLEEGFDDLVSLFAAVGVPTDGAIEFLSATGETAAGSYAVEITQLASRGQYTGAAVDLSGGVVIDAQNDEFSVRIDGVDSGPITLSPGSYASGEALAAEIQSRINADSALNAAGVAVAVAYTAGGFTVISQRYGSASAVEFTATDTGSAADLGLAPGAGVAGVDVAGSLGGVAATGSGQVLTGAAGTDAAGLRLLVAGGALGGRGTVDFSRGIAQRLDALIGDLLTSDGLLDARTDGLQRQLDGLDDQRERLDLRMQALEASLRNRFNALDTLLAQLQATSNFLTQQLATLPRPRTLDNG